MTVVKNTFELGTNGTDITTANSGGQVSSPERFVLSDGKSDDFTGTVLNPNKWYKYVDGPSTDGNGYRTPGNLVVTNGNLEIRGTGDYVAGTAQFPGQTYGAWEARVLLPVGVGYAPAILLWPDSNKWDDGEIDIFESTDGAANIAHQIIHKINNPEDASFKQDTSITPGVFHTHRVEWTPKRVTWFIDGVKTYEVLEDTVLPYNQVAKGSEYIPHLPMHLCLQLEAGVANRVDGSAPTNGLPQRNASTPQPFRMLIAYTRVYDYYPATTGSSSTEPGFSAVAPGSGASITYDNTRAAHGNLSAKVATGSTSTTAQLNHTSAIGTSNLIYGRMNLFLTSNIGNTVLAQMSSQNGLCAQLAMSSANQLEIRNSGGSLVTGLRTNTVPLNKWVRVEWKINFSSTGVGELKFYELVDATQSTFAGTGTSNFNQAASTYQAGLLSNKTNTTIWIDDLAWSTENWLGPVAPNDPPQVSLNATHDVKYGETIAMQSIAADPLGDALTYSWSLVSGPTNNGFPSNQSAPTLQFEPTNVGSYVVRLTVSDSTGLSVSTDTTLTVTPYMWIRVAGVATPLKKRRVKPITITVSPGWSLDGWSTSPWGGSAPTGLYVDTYGDIY